MSGIRKKPKSQWVTENSGGDERRLHTVARTREESENIPKKEKVVEPIPATMQEIVKPFT